jgi:hypothetical protein
MVNKTIASMNDEEFDTLVEQFIERWEDTVPLSTFLRVMADVANDETKPSERS